MTFASLGLQVDSAQARTATTDLQRLTAASAAAEKGANNLAQASQKSATVLSAIEGAAKRSGISVEEMTRRVEANAASHNKLAAAQQTAVKGMQQVANAVKPAINDNEAYSKSATKVIENLALQELRLKSTGREWAIIQNIRKAGVDVNSAAGRDIAAMTGRLYDQEQQAGRTNNSFDKLASTITRRFIAALIVKEVKDFTQYLWGLNSALAATADTADRAGVSYAKFQGLTTAAGYKGVTGDTFNAAILEFNKQVDLAKNGVGSLQVLLSANGKTVSDTATTFGTVADLVKNAGSEAQKFSILQSAGLPATREFAKLMEQGSGSINKIAAASTKLSNQQLDEAKRLNDKWNEMWTNFENWGKRAAVGVFSALGGLGSYYAGPQSDRAPIRVTIPTGGGASDKGSGKPTVDPELLKQLNSLAQQRLSILGPLLTVEQQVQQTELQLAAAGLSLAGVNKTQREALLNLTRAQAELSQIQAQASIGVVNLGAATAQAGHELQSWIDRKLLDPTSAQQMAGAQQVLAKRIEQTSDAARVARAPLEGLQRLSNEAGSMRGQLDTLATGTLNGLSDGLVSIANGSATAGDAFRNFGMTVVTALEKMIIQMTVIKPLADALQSSMGGGGFLSFLGIGGANPVVPGANMATGLGAAFPTFAAANGGTFGSGWGVVGERGPELIKVHNSGVTVIPNHISKPYLPGFAEGGTLSKSGGVARLPFGQNNAPSVSIGDINITTPEGMDPNNAKAMAAMMSDMIVQKVDERLGYQLKSRGMLNRAS